MISEKKNITLEDEVKTRVEDLNKVTQERDDIMEKAAENQKLLEDNIMQLKLTTLDK